MISKLRNFLAFALSLLIVYMALYLGYRFPHTETLHDEPVVVFGSDSSYVFFRPAAYVDGALTGMQFHQGPLPPPED